VVTGIAERDGSKPVICYWIQVEGLKRSARRAEPGARAEKYQLCIWVSAMVAIVLGLAIFAASWKPNANYAIDMPDYYSRLWPTVKPLFERWLQAEM
jgi:hypothetical protein